jgi:hypothetical protein
MPDFLQAVPEGIFEADAGAVSINNDERLTLEDFMTLIRVERDLVHGQSIIGWWRGNDSNFHQKR